jgi:hypothetical protein
VLGVYLRLQDLDRWVWAQSGFDESRDMLVARHIVIHTEQISKGPLAAGGFNWLQNSPIYYYFLAFIWFFTRNPINFMIIWSLMLSTMIPIGYLLGKTIWDKKLGLIIAALFAFHPTLINQSKELLQPFLLPLFSLLFLFFLSKFYKRKSLLSFCLSIFFLFIGLHFHYGVFLVLPIGVFWIMHSWFLLINNKSKWNIIYVPITLIFLIVGSWILLTYRNFPLDQVYFLTFNFSEKVQPLADLSKEILIILNESLWWFNSNSIQPIVLTFFFTVTIIYWLVKNRHRKKEFTLVVIPFSMSFSLFFIFFSRGFIAHTYITAVLPFIIISIAISLRIIIKMNVSAGLLIITVMCFIFYSLAKFYRINNTPTISYHNQKYLMAKAISDNLKLNQSESPNKFSLALLTTIKNMPYDLWGTSGIWYYLEIFLDRKLVTLTNHGVNFFPDDQGDPNNTSYFYLICDHRVHTELIETECLERFKSVRPYLTEEPDIIYSSAEFTLWKFVINTKQQLFPYNYVYTDLL